jgi:hypothetical protein
MRTTTLRVLALAGLAAAVGSCSLNWDAPEPDGRADADGDGHAGDGDVREDADVEPDAMDGDADARRDDGEVHDGADVDADADADGDGDADVDADAGPGCEAGTEPDGTWCDPVSGLLWEDPPGGTTMDWDAARTYCGGLSIGSYGPGSWELPTIDALRSLIRGCPATMTGGTCGITMSCPTGGACWSDACYGCSASTGPGTGGCYWPAGMGGTCGWFWSSSLDPDTADWVWGVYFTEGGLDDSDTGIHYSVRCVLARP